MGAMPTYRTVDDYIANQPEATQKVLKELRSLIKKAAPDAVEMSDYKVPSYTLVPGAKTKLQLMMTAYAKFVSFYPFPAAVEHFADELKDYETGKGAVKFPFDKPLPKDLIMRMVKFRKDEMIKGGE